MAKDLKEHFITTKYIAKIWRAEGWLKEKDKEKDDDQLADSIEEDLKTFLLKWGLTMRYNGICQNLQIVVRGFIFLALRKRLN